MHAILDHDAPHVRASHAQAAVATGAPPPAWHASLALRFARHGDATRAVARRHDGPLRIQRVLHPEGAHCAHAILLHPPGGIAGGDVLDIALDLESGAHVLSTTPGSTKWYRSNACEATQHVRLAIADDACLEWLPQESVLFDGAYARQTLDLALAPRAAHIGWDIVQLGRVSAGETWRNGRWSQRVAVSRGERVVWREQAALAADDPLRDSPLGLAGHAAFGTLWACAPALSADHATVLDAVRDAAAQHAIPSGATWLAAPAELLVIRALAPSADAVRALFEALWHTLRPCIAAMPPQRPRLWAT